MSSGPFVCRKFADDEYEDFGAYLERTGAVNALQSALTKLYNMPEAEAASKDHIHFFVEEIDPTNDFSEMVHERSRRLNLIKASLLRIREYTIKAHNEQKQEELRRRQIVELKRAQHQMAVKSPPRLETDNTVFAYDVKPIGEK